MSARQIADAVLILVVVDDSLVLSKQFSLMKKVNVLILVVVDDSLVHLLVGATLDVKIGLNPCCSGR